jgi:hypothetical protein
MKFALGADRRLRQELSRSYLKAYFIVYRECVPDYKDTLLSQGQVGG